MNKFAIAACAGLLMTGFTGTVFTPAPVRAESLRISQTSDQQYLMEVNKLLVENRAMARKIASKLGIESSSTTPGSGSLVEQNNALIIRNQMLFKQIAAKMGVEVYTSVPVSGTLIEQNHLLLRQNRTIVKGILNSLGIDSTGPLAASGSLVQQNRDLLMGNKAALQKLAAKLEVME